LTTAWKKKTYDDWSPEKGKG